MAIAVKTNGIGQRSDYHLNLTRSLADVWADEYIVKPPKRRKIGRPKGAIEMAKSSYAGKEYGPDWWRSPKDSNPQPRE